MKKTEAIKNFLRAKTHEDLSRLYNHNMEVQINVAQDDGERVIGSYAGKKWQGWTDNLTTWKAFRVPFKANTKPYYKDAPITWDLEAHVEGIGMTGWNWAKQRSEWVAFDFDAITGHSNAHSKKLTPEQLQDVIAKATEIEWVTIRRSTSGSGLHLYVFLDDPPTTRTHTEHAALARAILGKMTALTGFDFSAQVDVCGQIMWVWHRKMTSSSNGLVLIKRGSSLKTPPPNWRDHINVVSGKKSRVTKQGSLEDLVSKRAIVTLEDEHIKLLKWLENQAKFNWWWDSDSNMLVCHTLDLKEAHLDLYAKGFFDTESTGSSSQNCFAFAMRKGAWSVRRFSPGVQETSSWMQDGSGWTKCYFNADPDLRIAALSHGALEDPRGGFEFREAEIAKKSASLLGIDIDYGIAQAGRKTVLKHHKDGRLIVEIDRDERDMANEMMGWLPKKGKWVKIYSGRLQGQVETEIQDNDDIIRHMISIGNEDCGWVLKSENNWIVEPIQNIRLALAALGHNSKEISSILGNSVLKGWKMINRPFHSEYPGDRQWNKDAAQMRFSPTKDNDNLRHPTWDKLLNHCGSSLTQYIKTNKWCRANAIFTGGDYLRLWIASIFQAPYSSLPYLFFYGEDQNSGKSTFYAAISLLLTTGCCRVDNALTFDFNGEMAGAIICAIEETDLTKSKTAYNKIKDWVTSKEIAIHPKGKTQYQLPNTCHFIQTANSHTFCPIFPGDTRITMIHVGSLSKNDYIAPDIFEKRLEKEAPDFLARLISTEIPLSHDRLNLPVIETSDKASVQDMNKTYVQEFLIQHCTQISGALIKISEFYDRFINWLPPEEVNNWTQNRVGKKMPPQYPKGRIRKTGHFHYGNICWLDNLVEPTKTLHRCGEYLETIRG